MAGDTYLVNFQLAGAPVPTRYMADTGQVFGLRSNGQTYGWSADHTDQSRDRNLVPDQRLDTLIHFEVGQNWEFQLANGVYGVTVSIGDAEHPSTHTLNVEGVNYWNAIALTPGDFRQMTQQVTVSDGRLTLNQGAAIDKATRINYIHIVSLPSGPNAAPSAPTITEPLTDGQIVNHQDVHMEAVGYSDTDGNAHKSTDWEIWTVGPGAQPVWQTLGIEGVERLHTHLGDGVYINAAAGVGLSPDTDYQLRVRYRDVAGSVSTYATRSFHTAPATSVFPLELSDIAAGGLSWTSVAGPVALPPASPTQPQLRVSAADGDLLLSITGNNGVTNTVFNPSGLGDHVFVRVAVEAGSSALNLPETDLVFIDDHGEQHTIFLPAMNIAATQTVHLWVASTGATYYGTAAQTEPVFTSLARGFDAPVPYLATKPGFVIEEIAGGFALPVNIAFVPQPGPNPSDPLFYVTELYGTIKVVTRNFTVHTYATDLLNFDPTGAFPGSGEQGLAGIVVAMEDIDPTAGVDMRNVIYATRVWDTSSANGSAEPHHPQVFRFVSTADGLTPVGGPTAAPTVILNMIGENQGQSHQISNITIGPDGKLYVHMGDGFVSATAQNLDSFRGKILRMNRDGSPPTDNPFYNGGTINARDYVYAYGVRNPFGGAWRASDGVHYEVENGPSIDRFARVPAGMNLQWDGSDFSMTLNALYNWNPATAPVNITYVQRETFNGSQFPASMMDHAYVSESGPTLGIGPQARGKRIVEFVQNAAGTVLDGPDTFIEYAGDGAGSVVGLTAGPDGLYFTALYNDEAKSQAEVALAIGPGAKIYRVRYINPLAGDYDIDGDVDNDDFTIWKSTFGSNLLLAADGNRDGIVDAADYVVWRKNLGATLPGGGSGAGNGQSAVDAGPPEAEVANKVPQRAVAAPTTSEVRQTSRRNFPLRRLVDRPTIHARDESALLLNLRSAAKRSQEVSSSPAARDEIFSRAGQYEWNVDELLAPLTTLMRRRR
jgi:hypothetical protein